MQITDKNHIFLIGVIGFLFIVSHAADRKKNLTRAQINALVKPIKSYLLKQILIDEESEFSIASKSILPTDFTVKTACYSDDAMRLIIVYENGKIAFYTFNPTTHLFSQNDGPKIDMGAKKQSNLDNLYSFAAISGNGKYIALIPQFKKEAKVKGIYHGDWNLTLSSFLVDLNAINIQIVLNYLGDLCQINCNIDKKPTFIVTNFAEVSKYSQYIGSISKQSTCFLTTQLTQKNNTFMGQVTAILFALNQNNIIFNAYFESYKDAQLSPNGSLLAVLNASQLSICPIDHTFNRSTEELVTKVNFLDKLQDNNISIDFIDDSYIITKNKKIRDFSKANFNLYHIENQKLLLIDSQKDAYEYVFNPLEKCLCTRTDNGIQIYLLENNTRIAHKSIATSITHIKLASICTIIGIASIDNDYFLSSYTLAHWSNALNQFNTIKPHEALLMKDIYDSKVKNQSFQLSEEQKKTLQILDGNGASENYSLRKLIDLYLIKPQSQTKEFSISPTTDSEENSPILSQDILPLDQIQLSAQKTNTSSSNLTIPFIAKNSWRYLGKGVLPKYKNKIKPTQSTAFDIQHRSQQSQVTMGTDALMPEETIFTSPNRLEDEPYVVTRINPAESESVSVSTWNSIKQSANQVIETISTQVKSWYNWLTGMFR